MRKVKPKIGRIYWLYCKPTQQSYIGATIQEIKERWYEHAARIHKLNTKISNAIREHGKENFEVHELYATKDLKHCYEVEQAFIEAYQANCPIKGLNMVKGGSRGRVRK